MEDSARSSHICVFRFASSWGHRPVTVIQGLWNGVESVGFGQASMLLHRVVGHVAHCFGHSAEGRRQLCPSHGAVLVFAICIAVIAVFADAITGVSKVDFTAFAVITVGLHCIHCDCSCSHCEGQKQQ